MKKLIASAFCIILLSSCGTSSNINSMVATVQLENPVPGICNLQKVLYMLPFEGNGQIAAVPPMTNEELSTKLNAEVDFLKQNPEHNDEGMVGILVNCKGRMVQCKIDNETQSPELDAQIVAVFSEMKQWKAGTFHGKATDTSVLYSFKIEEGVITLN